MLFLIPIPIPAPLFGLIYLIYSAVMARKQIDNIGHDAHFYGAIFGLVATFMIMPHSLGNLIAHFMGYFN